MGGRQGQLDTLLSFIYTCFMLNDISYSNTSDASYGQPQVIITLVQIGMLSTQMFWLWFSVFQSINVQ